MIYAFTLSKYNITPESLTIGTRGTYGMDKIDFVLSDDWSGLNITVCFYPAERTTGVSVVYSGTPIDIPAEFTSTPGNGKMTIVGTSDNKQYISRCATLAVLNTPKPADAEPDLVTPSLAAQIRDIAENAESMARSVQSDADAGKFNGKSAYQSAYDGGYKGTEAEFNDLIASMSPFNYEKTIEIAEPIQSIVIDQFDDGQTLKLKELYAYVEVKASATSNIGIDLWYDSTPLITPNRGWTSMGYANGNLALYVHAYIGKSKLLEMDYVSGTVPEYVNYTCALSGTVYHVVTPISYNNPAIPFYAVVNHINKIVISTPNTSINMNSGKIVIRGIKV
ncbi:MAG: hypothetical protein VB118_02955 [Oscillospiraceae bacterium]|nr:hypothetical protein [Oscillospiraceae bacterium]